jgi:hypothetical chaperone protein
MSGSSFFTPAVNPSSQTHDQTEPGVQPQKKLGIGIDFGTSNTAAAVFDGTQVSMIRLEKNSAIMPSAIYLDRDFDAFTGQEAIDKYIAGNQGRKVELSAEVIGEARTSTGQIDPLTTLPAEANTNLVYGQSFQDASLPGRLFRGTKRLLGNKHNERITVFNRPFRLVALITPQLLRVRETIAAALPDMFGSAQNAKALPANHACIGHPVNFEGQETDHNQLALARLQESYRYAGVAQQKFYPEPNAAALSYLFVNRQHHHHDVVLTVDFGGGTLDFCILKRNATFYDVVAIHGLGLGGDHLDQHMFRKILFPLLGKGERWVREVEGKTVDTLFPFDAYEEFLINWTVSYMLNQNEYLTPVIDMIRQGGARARKFERLYELITQNYSYQVFQALKDCKAQLSTDENVVLDIPEIDVMVDISRNEFELIIADQLALFEIAVEQTLAKAGMAPSDISLVLRTGGSCLIPAVTRILEQQFPGKVVEHDPFTSVAAGLAIADYERLGAASN